MKVAVATPEQAGNGWTPLTTEWKTPAEIRAQVQNLVDAEASTGVEWRLVTLNRTVLDMVTSDHAKYVGHMTYEDVVVWKEGRGLVPLLDLHADEWLCHSRLGDLFERGLL